MLANVVRTIAYFCADRAREREVQNEPIQLRDEENAAYEGERHGTSKVRLCSITHRTSRLNE
jgi:hypothetical protein